MASRKEIERKIKRIYNEIYKQVFNKENIEALSSGEKYSTIRAVEILENSEKFKKFAWKFSRALAKAGLANTRGVWRKYFEAAKSKKVVGIPTTYQKFEMEALAAATRTNFTMIKTIPREMVKLMEHKYVSTLIEEVYKNNLPRGSFEKELKKHGAVNARVIARTETAKIFAAADEARAKRLKSPCYQWRASNDPRTRPSHKEMDGVIVFWRDAMDERPLRDKMRGNAGEFPNCRCTRRTLFDEDDLRGSVFRVYDYRTDNIIKMSKSELVSAMKRGEL